MFDKLLNLHLFDGDGGGDGASGSGDGADSSAQQADTSLDAQAQANANVIDGPDVDRESAFDAYIRENKDLYDKRVEREVKRRFRDTERLRADSKTLADISPALDLLRDRYGIKDGDVKALVNAIENDTAFYEDAAAEAGMTVEAYQRFAKQEREIKQLRQAQEQQRTQQERMQQLDAWHQQAEECKRFYPKFDLQAELQGENGQRLYDLMRRGIDVRTAYEVVYNEQIKAGLVTRAAAEVQRKTVESIKSRSNRPQEGGTKSGNTPASFGVDINTSTRAQREEIARRVMRGERITF